MFGSDLSERAKAENCTVPLVVRECIREVEARGLDYEGIYRKSGGAAQIRAIQLAFDNGDKINLSDEEEYNDICAVTSVLKQYFRELPDPLLTHETYDKFIQVSSKSFRYSFFGKSTCTKLLTTFLFFSHGPRSTED